MKSLGKSRKHPALYLLPKKRPITKERLGNQKKVQKKRSAEKKILGKKKQIHVRGARGKGVKERGRLNERSKGRSED